MRIKPKCSVCHEELITRGDKSRGTCGDCSTP